jgi:hypothetical protein
MTLPPLARDRDDVAQDPLAGQVPTVPVPTSQIGSGFTGRPRRVVR